MTWNIIQFSKDGKKIRKVTTAFFDGYHFGDRFLEGCEFEARVNEYGLLTVSPTPSTADYLKTYFCDTKKWTERAMKYVTGCGDNLFVHQHNKIWNDDELHLTDNLEGYLTDYELVTE